MLRAKWKHGQRSKGNQGNSIWKKTENIKETEIILRNHTVSLELRKHKRETKNSLKEFNSTFEQEEKRIRKLEDRTNEIIKLKTKESENWTESRGLGTPPSTKYSHYRSPGIRREQAREVIKRKWQNNFPNLMKYRDLQIQEVSNLQIERNSHQTL